MVTPYVGHHTRLSSTSFNLGVWFTGEESGVPGLFVDRDGGQLTVHRKNNKQGASSLFLHMHNATGDRAVKSLTKATLATVRRS